MITLTYTLINNSLIVEYLGIGKDQETPVNLTNHSYFNLNGHVCNHNLFLILTVMFTEYDNNNKFILCFIYIMNIIYFYVCCLKI